jgi:hypothetical protein
VDSTTIDGINVLTAHTIFAELGADLSAFLLLVNPFAQARRERGKGD